MSLEVEASLKVAFGTLICAAMVVGIHVCDGVAVHGSLVWWWEQIGHYGVFLAAVPFFFVCSGFFLGRHCDEDGWWLRECLKRVRSLLVPFLIWSAVFLTLRVGYIVISNLIHGRVMFLHVPTGLHYWLRAIGIHPFDYPLCVPLWYVRTLLVFVAISPLLVRFARSVGSLFVVYALSVVSNFLIPVGSICEFESKVFPVNGLFYFCFGLYLSRLRGDFPRLSRRCAVYFFCGGLIVVAFKSYLAFVYGWHNDHHFRLLFIPPILAGAWTLLPAVRMPTWAIRLSFPIYLLHLPVMFAGGVVFKWHTGTLAGWWMKYVLVVVGSFLMCKAMKRFIPRLSVLAFGGRL